MAHARRCHNLYYTIPCGMHNKQACTTACHMISWEFHSWNIPDWWYITAFRLHLKQFCHYGRWSECTPQSILIIKYGFLCQEQIAWPWKPIFWHHFDFSRWGRCDRVVTAVLVRSPQLSYHRAQLVLRWVTRSEYWVRYLSHVNCDVMLS